MLPAVGMRVLITGVAGFLGSHLADRLLARGCEVVGVDDLSGGERENVPDGVRFTVGDCCDQPLMAELAAGCAVVVHAAASAHEGLSVFAPSRIVRDNMLASTTVFSGALAAGVGRIVFCSSMARYGDQVGPFTEDMDTRPVDPYGIAKVASETLLAQLCAVHGAEYCIAVPHNLIGARQKYDDPYRNVASIMANLMLQGRQPFIYGDGEQQRCFSPVEDAVDCLERMVLEPGLDGLVVNIGPDTDTISINELARRLAVLCGLDELAPRYLADRPCEVKVATCSSDRARERLGYQQRHTLDQGLAQVVDHIRARGVRPFRYHLALEIDNQHTPRTWSERLM